MKRLLPAILAVSAAVTAGAAAVVTMGVRPPDARDVGTVRPAGSWGTATEVPGLGALNKGGAAQVTSESCGSAGNCAAGGNYRDRHGLQGFVAVERHGVWGQAIEVPGLAALNKGGDAELNSVSCASAGSCAAGGRYLDRHGNQQGFVAVERHGRWGTATEVPGLAALNTGEEAFAGVVSVSCASAGSCAAGGNYDDRHGGQGFVAVERHGRWGTAIEVPGLAALNKGGDAGVVSVSCASPGSCAAGGFYTDRRGDRQGFVAVERHGRWRTAIEVPGLAALNTGGYAEVNSVSCGSAGSCAAGGDYAGHDGRGFVAVERNGRWGRAIEVPGLGALDKGRQASVVSVSCAPAGSCAAGGSYTDRARHGRSQGFVAVERNGRWGTATAVPGLAALNTGGYAEVNSVSCAPAGTCAAGGDYADRRGQQGFVAVERNGRWGTATAVPGLAALNTGGGAAVNSVSCAPAGTCAAGGDYTDRHGHDQGFVVSQTG